jgi:GH15 family glucan-1,4-alpha-glucosidase
LIPFFMGQDAPPVIADYGLIGDGRSAALCSTTGSIDWLCLPRFDSDPVFGRLVGGEKAGRFSISISDVVATERRYRSGSAVLETTWRTPSGIATLTEGMVLDLSHRLLPQALLVRRLSCTGAPVLARLLFDPRGGFSGAPFSARWESGGLVCTRGGLALGLQTSPATGVRPGEPAEVVVPPGRPLVVVMSMAHRQPLVVVRPEAALRLLDDTDRWWRGWTSRISHTEPGADAVRRSLIVLRLLTYSPSGAPVAAPTTSLPEEVGGIRNWDYRYAWPRDAGIGIAAFLATGLPDESHSFLHWLLHASRLTRPRLRVLYTLDGKPGPQEEEVPGAPGYGGSRPVRIGNGATGQHQLDLYGWVVDAAWVVVRSGGKLDGETWRTIAGFADLVARRWREPDAGIWEIRGREDHHVHSKLMAWLALDRALRISPGYRARRSRIERWTRERDAMAIQIRQRGYDADLGSYVRAYGSRDLDAALLLLPALEFDAPGSDRLVGTIDAVRRSLSAGYPLIYRYRPGSDGLEGTEGAFLPCSFWLVQALALTGRREEARVLFEDLCSLSNDLGLFAEEIDPVTGSQLGNFPQALTHSALIQAALALQDATGG